MIEFLRFFNDKRQTRPIHLEIYNTKDIDWCIHIWQETLQENEKPFDIVYVQHCDMELCFAKAYVAFKEWLLEHEGGY